MYCITYTPARNCKTVKIEADNARTSLASIKVIIYNTHFTLVII